MPALLPIEPIIHAAETNEQTIEVLIECGDPLSVKTALDIANNMINALIRDITKRIFLPEEKIAIATHLVALGIVAIGRTDDIIHTLTHTREINAEALVEKLCEIRLTFAASEHDEISWIENLENEFPSEKDADTDR